MRAELLPAPSHETCKREIWTESDTGEFDAGGILFCGERHDNPGAAKAILRHFRRQRWASVV